jgi:hypothetical protein
MSNLSINAPNKACSGFLGVCAIYKHFSGFEFFLLPNRIHAHPHAGNANRSAADLQNGVVFFEIQFQVSCLSSGSESQIYFLM